MKGVCVGKRAREDRREARRIAVGVGRPNLSRLTKTTSQEALFARLASVTVKRYEIESEAKAAVQAARRSGATWKQIGSYLGVTAEAARVRYAPTRSRLKKARSAAASAREVQLPLPELDEGSSQLGRGG